MHDDHSGPDASAVLRDAGLRVTESRRAVLDALAARPHSSVDELFPLVVARMPGASRQSVYNALGDFTDAGIARRIEPAGRAGMYELRVGDNHHHLVCSRCGAVEDVDCVVGEAPCLTPSHSRGFTVSSAEVTFWGVCPACAGAPVA
ncbi:Fur family transcriptional regulator [Microbacterium aurantiacum]|uniref:Fur family transcriptional regulator n=1 Tax=Microbacterium aurantiacum TaxID=162393 RepID=UPI003F497E37